MRRVILILAALAGVVWVAGELPSSTVPAANSCETPWRRTRDGWELAERFLPPAAPIRSRDFHPLLLTAAEILASLAILAASSSQQLGGSSASP